ncbi:MAG TPA: hypothetical protein VHI78_09275 [Bacteroidales bacterium]|nr:hypothetical protein [Bacteroidales bacterium]
MSATANKKHIVYCNCGGERIPAGIKEAVKSSLLNAGVSHTEYRDLCGLAALQKDLISEMFQPGTDYLVVGCYKRTMDLLFSQAACKPQSAITGHINLVESSAAEAAEKIVSFCNGNSGISENKQIVETSGWPSWYPLIDVARCTNCGQCADFCLFGVYEKPDNQVTVVNPRGCKNNCPACARICPSAAIIFPKYMHGGAIGGSDEIDEKEEQQRQARDIENILGDDLYEALERRKARRRSIIREEIMLKALAEREKALGRSTNN